VTICDKKLSPAFVLLQKPVAITFVVFFRASLSIRDNQTAQILEYANFDDRNSTICTDGYGKSKGKAIPVEA
jgi:hypothetical protein